MTHNISWNTSRQNQGQIVTEMYPQLIGSAEGAEGPAKGLRLVCDASDGDWTLYADANLETVIARGNRFAGQEEPTVIDAIRIRKQSRLNRTS